MSRVLLSATALLVFALTGNAGAQSVTDSIRTARGMCRLWSMIPGGSNAQVDTAYSRCALDTPERPIGELSLPTPPSSFGMSGALQVIVNADGTVDPFLTREWTTSGERVLDAVYGWRFEPGRRSGTAVRSGFKLDYRSNARNDTLPSYLEWSYRPGPDGDSLIGTWHLAPAVPRLESEEEDTVFAASVRRLVEMRVLLPWLPMPYCLLTERLAPDERRGRVRLFQRLIGRASDMHYGFQPDADRCATDPRNVRLIWKSAHRTENGRVVAYLDGDYLEEWPPGFEGRFYRAWTGRCVVHLTDPPTRQPGCGIRPVMGDMGIDRRDAGPFAGVTDPDSLRMVIIATTIEAFQRDTFRTVVSGLAHRWNDLGFTLRPPAAVACAETPDCPGMDGLDAAQLDIAARGHLRFRLDELRPATRTGGWLRFRIYTNGAGPPHRPFVLVRLGGRWLTQWPRPVGPNAWEYGIITGYPPDTDVRVYLMPADAEDPGRR